MNFFEEFIFFIRLFIFMQKLFQAFIKIIIFIIKINFINIAIIYYQVSKYFVNFDHSLYPYHHLDISFYYNPISGSLLIKNLRSNYQINLNLCQIFIQRPPFIVLFLRFITSNFNFEPYCFFKELNFQIIFFYFIFIGLSELRLFIHYLANFILLKQFLIVIFFCLDSLAF